MKSRRNKNNSKRRLPKQNTKKHSGGGGPKNKGKTPAKSTGPSIEEVNAEIENIVKLKNLDIIPAESEIQTAITRLINSFGNPQTQINTINFALENLNLSAKQKNDLQSKINDANAILSKESQTVLKMAAEQREKELETQRKIAEREQEKRQRQIEEAKRQKQMEEAAAKEKAKKEAEQKKAETQKAKSKPESTVVEATTWAKKPSITRIISNKPKSADKIVIQDLTNSALAKEEPIIPTSNVEEILLPEAPPSPKKEKNNPTSNVEEILLPEAPPSPKKEENVPSDIKTAWVDTNIFTEDELIYLKNLISDKSYDAYSSVLTIIKAYGIKPLTKFINEKNPQKNNIVAMHEYYDIIGRILIIIGVLTEHIEKQSKLEFELCIKGGISAQILLSHLTLNSIIYETSDIDLIILPKNRDYYDREQLKQYAINISSFINFILEYPSNISVLEPKTGSNIIKMSYKSPENKFEAMIDIGFEQLDGARKPYYNKKELHIYKTQYGWYKIQNIDSFIKEKLFYLAYYQILYDRVYDCNNKPNKDCKETQFILDKFNKSCDALLFAFDTISNGNASKYYNNIYNTYYTTMNNYFETIPGFIPSKILDMPINI